MVSPKARCLVARHGALPGCPCVSAAPSAWLSKCSPAVMKEHAIEGAAKLEPCHASF